MDSLSNIADSIESVVVEAHAFKRLGESVNAAVGGDNGGAFEWSLLHRLECMLFLRWYRAGE